MLPEGTVLGHYRLLERIGAGGMGEVYVAEDIRRIERRVAIKVVRSESQADPNAEVSQEVSRLFQREMEAITLLDHPNILPMLDFGEQTLENVRLTYLVMPYRKEGSLKDWLLRPGVYKKLSLDDIDHLITQAADALQHAHNHHIVHQDVKPSNFLIREHPHRSLQPDLLLTDFGLAKLTNTLVTDSQQVRGTPTFMPPEQWRGKPVPATDQYALAILAYQLLTGSPPFTGGMEQVMYQHLTDSPKPPSAHSPSISAEIDAVILRALTKKPEERFPSINDFAAALHTALLSHEEPQTTPGAENHPTKVVTPPTTVVPPSSPPARDFPPPPVPSVSAKLPPPHKVFKVSPAILLTILVIVLILFLSSGSAALVYFSHRSLASQAPTRSPIVTRSPTVTRPPTMTPLPTATPSPTATPPSIAVLPSSALITPGTLTVGVTDNSYTYPPELYQDNNGQTAGFDIELMKAIAQAMNLKINIKPYSVGNLTPPQLFNALKAKQFDAVIDGQALTDQINANTLSVAYLNVKDVLLVLNGNPDHLTANAPTDFCGHTIGVQDHTIELIRVKATICPQGQQVNTVVRPDSNSLANALLQKQDNIEGIYQSSPTVSYYLYQFPGQFQAVGTPFQTQQEGIIIQQDNYALAAAIQNALTSLENNGTYNTLLKTPVGDLSGDSIVSN